MARRHRDLTDFDSAAFVRERNAALLSLDPARINAYCQKYGVSIPGDGWVYWAAVHKAICELTGITPAQRQRSLEWLRANGSRPGIAL